MAKDKNVGTEKPTKGGVSPQALAALNQKGPKLSATVKKVTVGQVNDTSG
jgi:hypothetical protein